ncbi:MAG: hypothetical protein ACLFTG_01195 [Alphaproteobacteria bacterium]
MKQRPKALQAPRRARSAPLPSRSDRSPRDDHDRAGGRRIGATRGIVPFFDAQGIAIARVPTARDTEFRGAHDRRESERDPAASNRDHARTATKSTATKSAATNGICARFHQTLLEELYRVAFKERREARLDEVPVDLDPWMARGNEVRTPQGRGCAARTPLRTFLDSPALARHKPQPGRAA